MSTRGRIAEDTTGEVPVAYNIEGRQSVEVGFDDSEENEQPAGSGDSSFLFETTNSVMVSNENAEESVLTVLERVNRYLGDKQVSYGEVSISPRESAGTAIEYDVRVPVDVDSAEQWVSIEEELQLIAVDSEVGDTNLYLLVNRLGS